uniref:Uncharacterized protein n=1 Tax=Theileria parva TaxID=5875 RepID=Q4N269_THEPA|eukprot:XP_764132.1 hypothetical protein [Theileria parva strain Muguga]
MKSHTILKSYIIIKLVLTIIYPSYSLTSNILNPPLDTNVKSTTDLPVTQQQLDTDIGKHNFHFIFSVQSNNFHNIDDEIRNKQILDTGEKNDISFNHNSGGCNVLKDDYIEVALDPHDILKTQELIYSITPSELRLYFKDRNSKKEHTNPPKKGKLFARFSFNTIVTPFETIASSRECFAFMVSLLKSKFCYVAHTALSPSHNTSKFGKKEGKLPQFSNKQKRLENLLKGDSDDVGIEEHENSTTNIDIKNIQSGKPQMFLRPSPDKPHRYASNSCEKLHTDMVECYKSSRCFKELNRTFEDCLNNLRPEDVGQECIQLKKALAQCRRNLLNAKFRTTGNPYSG